MKVKELVEMLKNVDGDVEVRIIIERGRGMSISDDVSGYYDEDNNVFDIGGDESDFD